MSLTGTAGGSHYEGEVPNDVLSSGLSVATSGGDLSVDVKRSVSTPGCVCGCGCCNGCGCGCGGGGGGFSGPGCCSAGGMGEPPSYMLDGVVGGPGAADECGTIGSCCGCGRRHRTRRNGILSIRRRRNGILSIRRRRNGILTAGEEGGDGSWDGGGARRPASGFVPLTHGSFDGAGAQGCCCCACCCRGGVLSDDGADDDGAGSSVGIGTTSGSLRVGAGSSSGGGGLVAGSERPLLSPRGCPLLGCRCSRGAAVAAGVRSRMTSPGTCDQQPAVREHGGSSLRERIGSAAAADAATAYMGVERADAAAAAAAFSRAGIATSQQQQQHSQQVTRRSHDERSPRSRLPLRHDDEDDSPQPPRKLMDSLRPALSPREDTLAEQGTGGTATSAVDETSWRLDLSLYGAHGTSRSCLSSPVMRPRPPLGPSSSSGRSPGGAVGHSPQQIHQQQQQQLPVHPSQPDSDPSQRKEPHQQQSTQQEQQQPQQQQSTQHQQQTEHPEQSPKLQGQEQLIKGQCPRQPGWSEDSGDGAVTATATTTAAAAAAGSGGPTAPLLLGRRSGKLQPSSIKGTASSLLLSGTKPSGLEDSGCRPMAALAPLPGSSLLSSHSLHSCTSLSLAHAHHRKRAPSNGHQAEQIAVAGAGAASASRRASGTAGPSIATVTAATTLVAAAAAAAGGQRKVPPRRAHSLVTLPAAARLHSVLAHQALPNHGSLLPLLPSSCQTAPVDFVGEGLHGTSLLGSRKEAPRRSVSSLSTAAGHMTSAEGALMSLLPLPVAVAALAAAAVTAPAVPPPSQAVAPVARTNGSLAASSIPIRCWPGSGPYARRCQSVWSSAASALSDVEDGAEGDDDDGNSPGGRVGGGVAVAPLQWQGSLSRRPSVAASAAIPPPLSPQPPSQQPQPPVARTGPAAFPRAGNRAVSGPETLNGGGGSGVLAADGAVTHQGPDALPSFNFELPTHVTAPPASAILAGAISPVSAAGSVLPPSRPPSSGAAAEGAEGDSCRPSPSSREAAGGGAEAVPEGTTGRTERPQSGRSLHDNSWPVRRAQEHGSSPAAIESLQPARLGASAAVTSTAATGSQQQQQQQQFHVRLVPSPPSSRGDASPSAQGARLVRWVQPLGQLIRSPGSGQGSGLTSPRAGDPASAEASPRTNDSDGRSSGGHGAGGGSSTMGTTSPSSSWSALGGGRSAQQRRAAAAAAATATATTPSPLPRRLGMQPSPVSLPPLSLSNTPSPAGGGGGGGAAEQ